MLLTDFDAAEVAEYILEKITQTNEQYLGNKSCNIQELL